MAEILKTLIPVGNPAGPGDYTLMSVAESTDQQDLVAGGNTYVLECYAGEISDLVLWQDWVTGPSNTITIKPAAGEEHNGVWGQGFLIRRSANYYGLIRNYIGNISFSGFSVENLSGGGYALQDLSGVNPSVHYSELMLKATGSIRSVFQVSGDGCVVENCLLDGQGSTGNGIGVGGFNPAVIRNCTVLGALEYGIDMANNSVAIIKNTVAYNSGIADFYVTGGGNASYTNNASGDATAYGSLPQTGVTTADFVDFAGGDYSPTSGGKLDGTGADLSTDFTTDITGANRTGSWTIGAYIVKVPDNTAIYFEGEYQPINVITDDPVVLNGWQRFIGSYTPFTYAIEWWLDQGKTQPTTAPPGLTFYPDDTSAAFKAGTLAGYPSQVGEWWFLITGTDTETNTAVSSPNPSPINVVGAIEFTGNIADISETAGTEINVPTAQEFTGGIPPYSYTLLSYDPPDPSWTVAVGSDGVITGTGPVAGADDYLYVRQSDSVVVAGDGNYFHEVIQLFPSLFYRMDDHGITNAAVIEAGQIAQDYGSPQDVAKNGTYGASRVKIIGNGVFNTGVTPGADVGDVSADLGLASPDNMASVIRRDADWSVSLWILGPPSGQWYPVWSNLNGTANGGVEVAVQTGSLESVRVTVSNKNTGQTESIILSTTVIFSEGTLQHVGVAFVSATAEFYVTISGNLANSPLLDPDNTFSEPDAANVLRVGASDGNPVKSTAMSFLQFSVFPSNIYDKFDILYDAGTNPGTSSAYSNPFSITFTEGGVGVKEMYIKDGGIFVKYTPYVKVGGTFQEVDAYVLDGGAWKPVHEK